MNRVDAALKQVGISLTDNNGKFRDMEDVLKEVGSAWDGLNRTQVHIIELPCWYPHLSTISFNFYF